MTIPFETKELVLKQVKFQELEPIERTNLQFFFPGYGGEGFSLIAPQDESVLAEAVKKGFDVLRDDTVPRRYAGDFSLIRSRYHTVCRDDSGDDGGTLVNELRAYSKPHDSGYFDVIDSTGSTEDSVTIRSFLIPGAKAVCCLPHDTPKFPSPYAKLVEVDRTKQRGQLAAIIPLAVTKQKVEKVIDLRKPHVQTWFTHELTNLRDPITNGPCFPLAGVLTDFTKLLPSLLAQSLGDGRSVTQIAGLWLRRVGANALVFPSARSNVLALVNNGHLTDWSGWNLVDYQGSPVPTLGGSVNVSPAWDKYPTFGHRNLLGSASEEETPFVYERVRISQSDTGPHAGSLRVEGLEEERQHFYGFQIWMHFLQQIREQHLSIDADCLLDASFALAASEGKKVDIASLDQVAQRFCFAILGEADEKKNLRHIASHFKALGDNRTATAVERLLCVCA